MIDGVLKVKIFVYIIFLLFVLILIFVVVLMFMVLWMDYMLLGYLLNVFVLGNSLD